MVVNSNAVIVPGHGTVFVAPDTAAFPADPLTAFTLTGTPPVGWTNLGHTSKQNAVAFSREGGDKTSLDSWLADAVSVVYASVNWGLTVNALQVDKENLDLAFGGAFDDDDGYIVPGSSAGQERKVFVLATDGTGKLGFYIPSTSITLGDAPSIDTSNFFELPLSAAILAADEADIPAVNGKPGIMKVYKTGLAAA